MADAIDQYRPNGSSRWGAWRIALTDQDICEDRRARPYAHRRIRATTGVGQIVNGWVHEEYRPDLSVTVLTAGIDPRGWMGG